MSKQHWHTVRERDLRITGLLAEHYMTWLRSARAGDFATAQDAGKAASRCLDRIQDAMIAMRSRTIGWWVYETTQELWEAFCVRRDARLASLPLARVALADDTDGFTADA